MRFVRLWFVDVLGVAQEPRDPGLRARDGAGGGRRASTARRWRAGARCASATPSPTPTRRRSSCCPGAPGSLVGADVLRRPPARRRAVSRRLARTRCGACSTRPPSLGYTFQVGARDRVLPLRRRRRTRRADARSTTAPTSTSRRSTAAATSAGARSSTSSRWGSRSRPPTTRSRPRQHEIDLAPHRRAVDGRRDHDVPRLPSRRSRASSACYATFMPKPLRAARRRGHAPAPLALRGRRATPSTTPTPTSRCRRLGRAFLAGVLAHARRADRGHQPVGQLLQAAGARASRRRSGVDWTRQRRPTRSCASRRNRPERETARAHRAALARPGLQPVPGASRCVLAAGLRGIERGYQLPPEDGDEPTDGAAAARRTCARRSTCFDASELARETLGDGLCRLDRAQQARASGTSTARPSPTSSAQRCLRLL